MNPATSFCRCLTLMGTRRWTRISPPTANTTNRHMSKTPLRIEIGAPPSVRLCKPVGSSIRCKEDRMQTPPQSRHASVSGEVLSLTSRIHPTCLCARPPPSTVECPPLNSRVLCPLHFQPLDAIPGQYVAVP